MKVLHLCNRVPIPANDGGNIAMLSIADSLLSQGVTYKMLALNTSRHPVVVERLPGDIRNRYAVEAIDVDTTVKPLAAFLNLFSSKSYNITRFDNAAFHKRLTEKLSVTSRHGELVESMTYDYVILESVFMAPYIETIRKHSKAKIILRAHNVEHIIWERLAVGEKKSIQKKYLQLLSRRLKRYEVDVIKRVDAILPITNEDAQAFKHLGSTAKMLTIPVGLNMDEYSFQADETLPLKIFHLGAMDWLPNLEGVEWFLKDCWQFIHQSHPKLELYLAGRGFPRELLELPPENQNIFPEGEILDAKAYMSDKQIMIVPLKSGGGMRVKIIQGMALGKTIISTTIGAEGINAVNGENILIANTPQEFLEQITRCVQDHSFCFDIGRRARAFAIDRFSQQAIGKKVMEFMTAL